ncbi:hypothetical protein GEMRC1_004082 [Eukaryota sp. GEM-RC1]
MGYFGSEFDDLDDFIPLDEQDDGQYSILPTIDENKTTWPSWTAVSTSNGHVPRQSMFHQSFDENVPTVETHFDTFDDSTIPLDHEPGFVNQHLFNPYQSYFGSTIDGHDTTINSFAFSPTTAITGSQYQFGQPPQHSFMHHQHHMMGSEAFTNRHGQTSQQNFTLPTSLSQSTKNKFCKNRECFGIVNRVDGKSRSPYCCNKCQTREQNLRQGRVRPNRSQIALKNTILILSQLAIPNLPSCIAPWIEDYFNQLPEEDPDPQKMAIAAMHWLQTQ